MAKKVLILSASARKAGNSDLLADQFMKGAVEAGNEVEKIFLAQKKIGYCLGCNFCKKNGGTCAIKDDMNEVLEKMLEADVIALASPVYYYNVNAQLKTLIDRTYAKFMDLKNKEFYFILSCADESNESVDQAVEALRGFTICLPGSVEKGIVYGVNAPDHGDIVGTKAMDEAYQMGKEIRS